MFCFHPLIGYLHLEKHDANTEVIVHFWPMVYFPLAAEPNTVEFVWAWCYSSLWWAPQRKFCDVHFERLRPMVTWLHGSLVIVRSQKVAALFAVTRKGGEREGKREGEGTRSCWNKIWSPETRTRECLELSTSGISHNLPPTPSSVTPLPAQVRAPQSSHSPRPDPPGEDQAFRGDASYLK